MSCKEFACYYTKHKTQKSKRYQDGTLAVFGSNRKVVLYNEKGASIDSMFWSGDISEIGPDFEMEFDNYLVTVDRQLDSSLPQKSVSPPAPKKPIVVKQTSFKSSFVAPRRKIPKTEESPPPPPPQRAVSPPAQIAPQRSFKNPGAFDLAAFLVAKRNEFIAGFVPGFSPKTCLPPSVRAVSPNVRKVETKAEPELFGGDDEEDITNLIDESCQFLMDNEEEEETVAVVPKEKPKASVAKQFVSPVPENWKAPKPTVSVDQPASAPEKFVSFGSLHFPCQGENMTKRSLLKDLPDSYPGINTYVMELTEGIVSEVQVLLLDLSARYFSLLTQFYNAQNKGSNPKFRPRSANDFFKFRSFPLYEGCSLGQQKRFMGKDGGLSVNSSLFLHLDHKESSSAYAKDDLWILAKDKDFSDSCIVRSVFHGPGRNNDIEVVPVSTNCKSFHGNVVAIHGPNVSTELSMLKNLEDLSEEKAPILRFLVDPQCDAVPEVQPPFEDMVEAEIAYTVKERNLNADQEEVVRRCVHAVLDPNPQPPVVLVHGVFGAGKSTVLVVVFELLARLLNMVDEDNPAIETRILFASTTNAAVDRVLVQLLEEGFTDFLRVGSRKKMDKSLFPFSLHCLSSDEDDISELKELLKTTKDPAELASIRREIKEVTAGNMSKRRELIQTVRIIGATCAACSYPAIQNSTFKAVFLDECSQMIEPLSLLCVGNFKCERAVLVGDPKQLRPVLASTTNLDSTTYAPSGKQTEGLAKTMFSRLENCGCKSVMLRTQYRCHPTISGIANKLFYRGKLLNGVTEEDRAAIVPWLPPVVLMHLDTGREEADSTGSFKNEQECKAVVALVTALYTDHELASDQIGVICLYKSQAAAVQTALFEGEEPGVKHVQVSTVDAFQGSERDVIILACTRTKALGFSDNPKRLNVAITRAKRHLIIVGSAPLLSTNELWDVIISPALAAKGGVQSCSQIIATGHLQVPAP